MYEGGGEAALLAGYCDRDSAAVEVSMYKNKTANLVALTLPGQKRLVGVHELIQ